MKKLEHIRVRPLSADERSRAWNNIAARIPSTPALSPFAFPIRKAVSMAVVFILIIGTVGASDMSRPGQALFPIDVAVERIESSIDPSSQADHARERLMEFDQALGNAETQTAQDADQAPVVMRMEKAPAPEADMAMMSAPPEAPAPTPLSTEVEQAIEKTRNELEKILNAAVLRGDTATVLEIAATVDEFEERVRVLRGQ